MNQRLLMYCCRFDEAMQSFTLLGTPSMLPSSAFTLATQVCRLLANIVRYHVKSRGDTQLRKRWVVRSCSHLAPKSTFLACKCDSNAVLFTCIIKKLKVPLTKINSHCDKCEQGFKLYHWHALSKSVSDVTITVYMTLFKGAKIYCWNVIDQKWTSTETLYGEQYP